MLYLLPEVLVFLSKHFNLILTLKKSSLEVILLARDHRDLVLHIWINNLLLFQVLPCEC